ncbi:hypothetical protein [Brevibacillus sp. H7]|uniref:hypothetical protein n=1 Tax=Brevibacillus sp. H7 TaxID=3349138 RepID=UPI003818E17A
MFTKDEYFHTFGRISRKSGFRNAGRIFGLTYRNLRLSMNWEPERRESYRERRHALLAAWKEFVAQLRKEEKTVSQPAFPQLEKKVSDYVAELQARGISYEILKDEVLPPTCGICVRKVLIADCRYMKVFVQLWTDTRGPLKDVSVTEIHADDALAFAGYLDKKRFPQQAEGGMMSTPLSYDIPE